MKKKILLSMMVAAMSVSLFSFSASAETVKKEGPKSAINKEVKENRDALKGKKGEVKTAIEAKKDAGVKGEDIKAALKEKRDGKKAIALESKKLCEEITVLRDELKAAKESKNENKIKELRASIIEKKTALNKNIIAITGIVNEILGIVVSL